MKYYINKFVSFIAIRLTLFMVFIMLALMSIISVNAVESFMKEVVYFLKNENNN